MGYLMAMAAFVIFAFAPTVLLRSLPVHGPMATALGCTIGAVLWWLLCGRATRTEAWRMARRHPWRVIGLGLTLTGCTLFFQWAVALTIVANVTLLSSTQPLLTCLIAIPLLGGRRPTAKGYAALALGMAGLSVLLWPQLSLANAPLAGIGLAFLSAVCYTAYVVQLPFLNARTSDGSLLLTSLTVSAVSLLPVWAFAALPPVSPRGWAMILAFGALDFLLANLLYFAASRRIPIGHLSTMAYVDTPIAIAGAAVFLNEPVTASIVLGDLLIVGSTALLLADRAKAVPPPGADAAFAAEAAAP